jgi:FKBP-type peptidyl-prolyl cis-trans isomerase FkpA
VPIRLECRAALLLTCTLAAVASAQVPGLEATEKRLAVLEFRGRGATDEVRALMADEARAGALEGLRGRRVAVMSRENMAAMLKDMGKAACAEGECEVETARNIGADYVVTGEVVLLEGEVRVSLKLHESAGGRLLATRKTKGARASTVVDQLAAATTELVSDGLGLTRAKAQPVGDQDGDGLSDDVDKCPDQAEDRDGFEDSDGCPEPDNDQDGLKDGVDKCPNDPGPATNGGCPVSAQPVPPETAIPELKLQLRFAPNSTRLDGALEQGLLDQLARGLAEHPGLPRIRIVGRADKAEKNAQKLSQDRAEAVLRALVVRKVDARRLEAVGYGSALPEAEVAAMKRLFPGGAGFEPENRRVDFVLLAPGPPEGAPDDEASTLARQALEPGAQRTPSGLVFRSLVEGTGPSPTPANLVKVHYRGTMGGTEFDSSYKRGAPAEFPLTGVIKCWTEAIVKMHVGGKAKFTCPSALAYGSAGAGSRIPPNSVLTFEVELLGVVR